MKKLAYLLLAAVMAVTTLGVIGCKPKTPDDTENVLEVFCTDKGYGTKWCSDLLELFQQQDWVKEKYPNLTVLPLRSNDVENFTASRIDAGAKNNSIDLFFDTSLGWDYMGVGPSGEERCADLTETVYNSLVPGEEDRGVKVIDKILDSYNMVNAYYDPNDPTADTKYYFMSWAGGMEGFLYNKDLLNGMGLKAPNTTDELEKVCAAIAERTGVNDGKYNLGYSFIQSKDADYWAYLFNIWWAQYQGKQGFTDFWNGVDENRISKNIFTQKGRVRALEVYEKLLKYDKGYLNPASGTYDFKTAQTMFLQGNGVFHANGDWFDNEMSSIREEIKTKQGVSYDIRMLRTPVVSSIVETLENKEMTDETLSAVIAAVDEGKTSYEGVSAADFARIREARSIVYSVGSAHVSAIPAYAAGKDVAMDFLRFMTTDIANESYIRSTGGASLPVKYNVVEKNPELFASLSGLQKSRLEYFNNGAFEIYTLPQERAFPLYRYGNVKPFVSAAYYATFSAKGNTKTPADYQRETELNWTDAKWTKAVNDAGLTN